MEIKKIITILKERGLTTDDAVEFIDIASKISISARDNNSLNELPTEFINLDDTLTILQKSLTS